MKSIEQVQIPEKEAQKLAQIANEVQANPYTEVDSFVEQVNQGRSNLELSVDEKLRQFSDDTGSFAVQITGLPVQLTSGIATPKTRTSQPPKSTFLSEAILLTLVTYLGEPFCFAEENFGHLIVNHNILMESVQLSWSEGVPLIW